MLIARDNPFFPAKGMEDLQVTSNENKSISPLQQASISLPDSARVIKEVTLRYQNLDGSIGSRTVSLENSVDWHLPVFITQSYSPPQDAQQPIAPKKKSFKTIASFKELAFDQSDKTLLVRTNDPLIRHFMMIKPHRIVMDFKRTTDFRSKSKLINTIPYKAIRLGNHDGYYRAVVELDGQYQYNVDNSEKGTIKISVY